MNKKILLIIPLVVLACILLFNRKNILEKFLGDEYNQGLFMGMRDDRKQKYEDCKKYKNKIYNPDIKVLWRDLINPKPTYPDETVTDPNEYDPELEIESDAIIYNNFKDNCLITDFDPENYMLNPEHINHKGALKHHLENGQKEPGLAKNNKHTKIRYAFPVVNIEKTDKSKETDSYNPNMGNINLDSPEVINKWKSWKWYRDGDLQMETGKSLNNPGIGNKPQGVEYSIWNTAHPYDVAKENGEKLQPRDSYYIDMAQSKVAVRSKPNPVNNNPSINKIMKEWGTTFGQNPNKKIANDGKPFQSVGDHISEEAPLDKITPGTMAYTGIPQRILAKKGGGCAKVDIKAKPPIQEDICPFKNLWDTYPEKYKSNSKDSWAAAKMSDKLKFIKEHGSSISTLKDLEEHQYKRKMIPGTGAKQELVHMYGKPFGGGDGSPQDGYDKETQTGNKVLASSGYDATQFINNDGNLNTEIKDGIIVPPKLKNKIQISQEKKCPESLQMRYYYENPGLPDFSEWYITGIGGSYSQSEKMGRVTKNQKSQQCTQCSNPGGCKYPNETGGTYSSDYYELQKCGEGLDRICKKCRTCKMGLEVVDTDCGEGGGAQERTCCSCSECPNGTYKVYGCDQANSFFDTECKPFSKCRGFKPDAKKTDELMTEFPAKHKNLNTYESDPGDGNRMYAYKNGLQGGFKDKDKTDPVTGQKLKNPYFGRDTKCEKCDTCPTGWSHLRGCMGENDDENTVCQRSIDKESYMAKNFQCPPKQFYSKDKISSKIDEMNRDLQKRDEVVRQRLTAQNQAIKDDPVKSLTTKPININDPANFPESLPQLSDDDLMKIGCSTCKTCPGDVSHRDPNSPGCIADKDTTCKPHTPCKDFQYTSKEGDSFKDQQCSSCRCPQPDYYGFPDCTETSKDEKGTNVPKGCKRKVDCKQGEFVSSDPGVYGDTTLPRICKKCKKCNYGSFTVKGGCRVGGATDTVCKEWKQCDKNSMIVIEPGTSEHDTICKCLDGFELPKNKFSRKPDLDASKCVPIKGKCHTMPCHPKANCFDNFTDDGQYMDTICECNIEKGFIQTEKKGFGKDGCFSVPGKHTHKIMTPAASYGDLPPKFAKILTHVDDKYHRKKVGKHLHKNAPLKIDDEGIIIS